MAHGRSSASSATLIASRGFWLSAALVCGAGIAAFGFDARAGGMRDFEVYWTAAVRAADAEPLYRVSDEHFQFKYLPAFAVLAGPIGFLPLHLAKSAWFVISVALIPLLVALSVRSLPATNKSPGFIALIVVVVMAKFFGHELVLGQVNLLFAVIAAYAILLLRVRKDAAAGLLVTAAIVVKPYAVLLLPWLLWLRRPAAMGAAAASGLAVIALPAVLYGLRATWDLHLAWWNTVTTSTAPNLTNPDNVSLAAFFAKWMGIGPRAGWFAAAAAAILVVGMAYAIVRGRHVPQPEPLDGALLLTAIPLLSPQGWDYVFLVSAPAVALFANYSASVPQPLRATCWISLFVVGFSLFDVMGRQRYGAFMAWSVITLCFLVLIASLVAARLRKAA